MKKFLIGVLVAGFAVAGLASCPAVSYELWAGMYIDVGAVLVWNDAEFLYVQYVVDSPWVLTEAKVGIQTVPYTERVPPGKLPYSSADGYFKIPVGALPLPENRCGAGLYLQAHGVVVQYGPNGEIIAGQTAYGGEITKPRRGSWYGNIAYTWCCDNGGKEEEYYKETAYAYAEDGICFISQGFGNWGWTIPIPGEGTYMFALYRGAGQCDLAKGTYVGTVTVTYGGGTVAVAFNLPLGYELVEQQVYAGKTMFPMVTQGKKIVPTVAPGQYYIEPDLSGAIYVIVHAVVGWWE